MRVLLLNQTFFPDQAATSQQLLDFAQYLHREGCEVTVVASRRSYSDPKKAYPSHQMLDGIHVVRVGSTGFGRRSFFHRFVDGLTFELALLPRLLFFRRQDLVIAYTSPPLIGFVGLVFCSLRGGRCVQWMMDLNPDIAFAVGYLRARSIWGRVLTSVLRFTLRNSDHIIVLDRWMRQRLLAHGVETDRIVVVPPWPVNEPTPADSELGQRFRARHGIKQRYVVLYSGNHSIAHPLDTLLDAALALRNDPDVLFLFIGGGLRETDVAHFVQIHGLTNIRQLPHQPREQLQESLSAADLHIIVMGARISGLVHVSKIYGVLSTGRPYIFIGPRASHVVDLLGECPFGFHVEHGDAEGLVRTIQQARALSAPRLQAIFEHNTAYAKQNCSIGQSVSSFALHIMAPIQASLAPTFLGRTKDHVPSRA